jgi:hypothetical protein
LAAAEARLSASNRIKGRELAAYGRVENCMADNRAEMRIPMQVGTEFRIRNNGDIIVDNPELELAADPAAAGAVLSYRFDAESGEHILRLLEPVAERGLRPSRKAS